MDKISYSLQISVPLSDQEKEQAEKAIVSFNNTIKLLKAANDHLKIIYNPFKENPEIPKEQLVKYRAAMRRFRDKSVENFNTFKYSAFKCITLMQPFSSDTQTTKLLKSFVGTIEDIETKVNSCIVLFDYLDSATFVQDIIGKVGDIIKESERLKEFIEDRVNPYIQNNILGKTWMDNISQELKIKLEKKKPLQIELYDKEPGIK